MGQQTSKAPSLPLIDHWNGTAWSQATPPSFPATNGVHLGWVSSSSAADAWAVGTINLVKHPGYFGPLTVHWDGSTWTNVPDPLPLNPGTALVGVADISSTNAYAIGNEGSAHGLVEQWNGTAWNRPADQPPFPEPNGDTFAQNTMNAISASSASNVWIVGTYLQTVYGNIWDPYSVHWDGTAWNLVTMPQVTGAVFTSADAISPANVWRGRQQPVRPAHRALERHRVDHYAQPRSRHAHRHHRPLGLRCVGRGVHHRAADPHPALGRHHLDDRAQPQRGQRQPADVGICQPWRRDCLGCRVQRRLGLVQPAHPSERLSGETRDRHCAPGDALPPGRVSCPGGSMVSMMPRSAGSSTQSDIQHTVSYRLA